MSIALYILDDDGHFDHFDFGHMFPTHVCIGLVLSDDMINRTGSGHWAEGIYKLQDEENQ